MKRNTLTRRTLLRNTVRLAVLTSAPVLLQGCKKAELTCEDTSGLSEEDAELRTALEYRDRSPHERAKNCSNCAFFVAGAKNQCGQCTLVRGPINPLGYCNSWAAKG
jgi:hypothetical protein